MRKKKFIAMALVAMLSLSGLTGCSDKDKADISNKLNNKTTETTKKDDSKADDKTSESTTEDKSDNKKSDSDSDKPAEQPSKPNGNNASKPHEHTWVDHTATKKVPRTVHHDAVYETVTIPAVTKHQFQCTSCGQWCDSKDDLYWHFIDSDGACGNYDYSAQRDVVITPAHTEQKLVKEAYDETVYDTQTYVDYQYCSGCGQHQ